MNTYYITYASDSASAVTTTTTTANYIYFTPACTPKFKCGGCGKPWWVFVSGILCNACTIDDINWKARQGKLFK
jgi:hypothetical protein